MAEVVVTAKRLARLLGFLNIFYDVFNFWSYSGGGLDPCDTITCSRQHQQLTPFGRALAKHGGRPGSVLPAPKGSPGDINAEAAKIVDWILEEGTPTVRQTGRLGTVTDTIAPDGQGVRFDSNGNFIEFLAP